MPSRGFTRAFAEDLTALDRARRESSADAISPRVRSDLEGGQGCPAARPCAAEAAARRRPLQAARWALRISWSD